MTVEIVSHNKTHIFIRAHSGDVKGLVTDSIIQVSARGRFEIQVFSDALVLHRRLYKDCAAPFRYVSGAWQPTRYKYSQMTPTQSRAGVRPVVTEAGRKTFCEICELVVQLVSEEQALMEILNNAAISRATQDANIMKQEIVAIQAELMEAQGNLDTANEIIKHSRVTTPQELRLLEALLSAGHSFPDAMAAVEALV